MRISAFCRMPGIVFWMWFASVSCLAEEVKDPSVAVGADDTQDTDNNSRKPKEAGTKEHGEVYLDGRFGSRTDFFSARQESAEHFGVWFYGKQVLSLCNLKLDLLADIDFGNVQYNVDGSSGSTVDLQSADSITMNVGLAIPIEPATSDVQVPEFLRWDDSAKGTIGTIKTSIVLRYGSSLVRESENPAFDGNAQSEWSLGVMLSVNPYTYFLVSPYGKTELFDGERWYLDVSVPVLRLDKNAGAPILILLTAHGSFGSGVSDNDIFRFGIDFSLPLERVGKLFEGIGGTFGLSATGQPATGQPATGQPATGQ